MNTDFGDGMEEGGWASLPHGTIVRVVKQESRPKKLIVTPRESQAARSLLGSQGLMRVYWVDQKNTDSPRQSLRIYSVRDCPDELSAYLRFAKEMEDG